MTNVDTLGEIEEIKRVAKSHETRIENKKTLDYLIWLKREYNRPGGYWLHSEFTGRRKKVGDKV